MDPLDAWCQSEGSCGSNVYMVEMAPIVDSDCLVPGPGCSVPMGISPEKLLESGHFTALDIGHVKDCFRRVGSDEYIFNISSNFDRYTACMEQGGSSQEQGSSSDVVGDCSTLDMKGGGSSSEKSPVYPVWVENFFDRPQDTSNLVVGVKSCVPIAIMEVASGNGASSEVVHMV